MSMLKEPREPEEVGEGIVLVPFKEELEFIPFMDVLPYEEQKELLDYNK